MTTRGIHQLPIPAKANPAQPALSAQRGCSQNGELMSASHQFAVSAKANPAQPVLSAQRGRSQNRQLMRAVGANSFAHRTGANRCRANEFAPTAPTW